MFETAELGHKIDKEAFAAELPALRTALLDAQFELLKSKKFQVILLIGGVDGAGKGETVHALSEWLDPRHIEVHGVGAPTDEDCARPDMWRFWRVLPPRGKIGIFFGSWYTAPIVGRVLETETQAAFDQHLESINRFERMLADEGALVLKFWFHLSKKAQKKRLEKLEDDPRTRWRVTKQDWKNFKKYDHFKEVSARALRETNMAHAPWIVVEGQDERYRSLTVGKTILAALQARLATQGPATAPSAPAPVPAVDHINILDQVDLTEKTDKATYEARLEEAQGKLSTLLRRPEFKSRSLILAFEGWDAAGKGGAIRRVTAALDPRSYEITAVAAPTEEERLQPYLWRFWRKLPGHGRVGIFDRTWYGRVMVERVEGFCKETDWLRAYSEINDFEEQLVKSGAIVCKFFLHLSAEEQLRRFEERQGSDFKRFKITDEDWRNREKWPQYVQSVCDLVDRTSTEIAPWTLVSAEDKYTGRLQVLETIAKRLQQALGK
jgi:polyphosphate:AMP phosphotransferase